MRSYTKALLVAFLLATAALASHERHAVGAGVEGEPTGSLVFERAGDLYRLNLDGSPTVRLTKTKVRERSPAVSPDGRLIAHVRGRDALWLMNANGTDPRRLLAARPRSVNPFTDDPAWPPDGRVVFFARKRRTPNEDCSSIFRIRATGGGLTRVTDGLQKGWLDNEPAVSPDERRIALSRGECEPGPACCYLVVVDMRGRRTTDLRRLPNGLEEQFSPSWAPDGRRIAFSAFSDLNTPMDAIYVANRDGSGLSQLTESRLQVCCPSWSPDGQWIAFLGGTTYDLFLIRPDGSGVRRLTRTKARESSPAWFPNP